MEVVAGTGDDTSTWSISVALLKKHSYYLCTTLCGPIKQETPTMDKITLADRPASIFEIYVQWMYTDTIPNRFSLSRMSTGKPISNSFQLWTLSDYLEAGEFKNRIMCEMYNSYSLVRYLDGFDFMELSPAEVDYCWSSTVDGSKLRVFMLDILSHHITFGDYIHIESDNDWQKTFAKHTDLQVQLLARIAATKNTFTSEVAAVPAVDTYMETVKVESKVKSEEPGNL